VQLAGALATLGVGWAWLAAAPPVEVEPEPRPRVEVDGDAELRQSLYVDNDHTTVATSEVEATVTPGHAGVTMRAGYLADVISSASVDVVSAATTRWQELRNQGSGGLSFSRGQWQGDVGYTFSDENDWTSHTGAASVGRDLFQRNTNISVGYVFVHNQIFRANDVGFEDHLVTHAGNVALTQVLGKTTNARLTGFVSSNDGLQSSPYRYVPIGRAPGAAPDRRATCVSALWCPREQHPRGRYRFAVTGTLLQYVGRRRPAALEGSYRFYGDTWRVLSHTMELAYKVDLHRVVQLRVRSRTYYQGAASFYEEYYDAPQRYISIDRELSRFLHQLAGVKLTYKSGALGKLVDLRIDIKADVFYFHFFNFRRLPSRLGAIAEAGIRLVF